MGTRTRAEMEKDFVRIKEAARTATSYQGLAQQCGLTVSKVKTTLAQHPIVSGRIAKQLVENKRQRLENIKKYSIFSNATMLYCIDTSIVDAIENWTTLFDEIMQQEYSIIVTSIVLDELDNLQKSHRNDYTAVCARKLIHRIFEDEKHFVIAYVKKEEEIADNCILNYCKTLPREVTLITADKIMAMKASRGLGMKTLFWKTGIPQPIEEEKMAELKERAIGKPKEENQSLPQEKTQQEAEKMVVRGDRDIPGVKMQAGELVIQDAEFDWENRILRVYSPDFTKEIKNGPHSLQIGEHVFVLSTTDVEEIVIIDNYRIVHLTEHNHAIKVTTKKIDVRNTSAIKKVYEKIIRYYMNWYYQKR